MKKGKYDTKASLATVEATKRGTLLTLRTYCKK